MVRSHVRPPMGIFNERYRSDVVSPQGYILITTEAETLDDLGHQIGGMLSEYTMEEGEILPKGTVDKKSKVVRVGPITVKRIPLGETILEP